MQTQRVLVPVRVRVRFWFIALYVLLLAFNNCDSHQHQNKHNHKHKYNHNHNKARSKYTTQQSFDDKPEGKIFGWKKQPQTNVFFITRPPTLPTSPLPATATTTVFTSPVPAVTVPTAPAAPATVTTVRRPYVQRYGGGGGVGYRRVPVRRQNVRQGQGYRTQRPWNRRRVWAYGREDEVENGSPSNADGEVDTHEEDEKDVKVGVGLKEGVNAKLDIEQLGKALLSQQDTQIDNDAGQIAVMADDLNKVYKQRLKVKSKRPQTTAILATTLPTTFMPAATATDDATSNDEPTYGNIVVHSNGKTKNTKKKSDKEGDKRPTIWQGIRQAWRERRERQKNAALKKKEEQEEEQEKPQVEIEDGENEIFIDENGEIYIRRRRRHKNNNRNRQQNTRQQQLNIKNKQKKKRKQQEKEEVEEEEVVVTNNKNSVISENNTNSRFQNIMNAFRRTPIIYKQQSR